MERLLLKTPERLTQMIIERNRMTGFAHLEKHICDVLTEHTMPFDAAALENNIQEYISSKSPHTFCWYMWRKPFQEMGKLVQECL